ncbi:hypothetical protein BDZ85DRAFT_253528 [Elsinoe ampelina]|uniref:ZZ-type domain-containing protein n=1 Tax=Elsinoe ampelina TaxID=302913 RepID=A0A6A6FZ53_9PEZI|nr:hypothetical protein BDZ85DRAFT_253528 [Elsinoe ampelina]
MEETTDKQKYTVGWICALHNEYFAARAFLDERHPSLDATSHADNNDYTLGRIGKHNVVIAVCPDGGYGNTSAAHVARDLVHTFQNVRLGLMVGIGGGAPFPPERDIRLGDVVVSSAVGGLAAVIQYGMGKKRQGVTGQETWRETFEITGQLDRPPMALRTAVNGLKVIHQESGNGIYDKVEVLLNTLRKPVRKEYQRPAADTDLLMQTDFVHQEDARHDCSIHDKAHIIVRDDRGVGEDLVEVHYGPIGSADTVMKDAKLRDDLRRSHGLICFDMEAAGLMNHFPCLVIRGIADYSDSHKNKQWQNYAAMTAAAYAKELLLQLVPRMIENQPTIQDLLSLQTRVVNDVTEVREAAVVTHHRLAKIDGDSKQSQWLRWLNPADPSVNYNKAKEDHHPGTGRWLLDHQAFRTWFSTPGNLLWLYGGPGVGKSVLCSVVIDWLFASDIDQRRIAYFYFHFADSGKQALEDAIRSLIWQLSVASRANMDSFEHLWQSCKNGQYQPSLESLNQTLTQMLQSDGDSWIVLDALDECRSGGGSQTSGVLPWIRSILQATDRVYLLTTSRPTHDLQFNRLNLTCSQSMVEVSSAQVTQDIDHFVSSYVRTSESLRRWRAIPVIQEKIIRTLVAGADGMFLWAARQLEALRPCLDKRSLLAALADLPKDLYMTYDRIIQNTPAEQTELMVRLLQFLLYSERPLRLAEAVDALAVSTTSATEFDPSDRMPQPAEITAFAPGLIVVAGRENDGSDHHDGREVRLAHHTVRNYLRTKPNRHILPFSFESQTSRAAVADVCLAYLCGIDMSGNVDAINEKYPFAGYSAEYWASNLRGIEEVNVSLLFRAEKLMTNHGRFEKLVHLHSLDRSILPFATIEELPLYHAVTRGLPKLVEMLLMVTTDIDAVAGRLGSPLHAAAYHGNVAVARVLLEHGANVNNPFGSLGSAVRIASWRGHREMVQILLECGADAFLQPRGYASMDHGVTPLPSRNLDAADMSASLFDPLPVTGFEYDEAVDFAASRGISGLVNSLLSDSTGNELHARLSQALNAAASHGHLDLAAHLIEDGADVNARTSKYGSALGAAAASNSPAVVELLLDRGADIDTFCRPGVTALHVAIISRHFAAIDLLLRRGASVNLTCGGKLDVINIAWMSGDGDIMRLLRSHGAPTTNPFGAPYQLMLFSCLPRPDLEEELHGFDIDTVDLLGRSALHFVALRNVEDGGAYTIESLLRRGMDVNNSDNQGWTPLHWAAHLDNIPVMLELCRQGADVNLEDIHGCTALAIARIGAADRAAEVLYEKVQCGSKELGPSRERKSFLPLCDCCTKRLVDSQYHCTVCPDYDLCFRCIEDAVLIHPGHTFVDTFRYSGEEMADALHDSFW